MKHVRNYSWNRQRLRLRHMRASRRDSDHSETNSYDLIGNRTRVDDNIFGNYIWTANALNQCIAEGSFADNLGNVVAYVDESGTKVASYTYDAFGQTVSSTGPMREVFPHRFSTKWHDDYLGMVDYGRRWYHPRMGRWINRDPIGEEGGENLYGFCKNIPVLHIDKFGMLPWLSAKNEITIGKCGIISVFDHWNLNGLPEPQKLSGSIVQNMTLNTHIFDCSTRKEITADLGIEESLSYAEAFRSNETDEWLNLQSYGISQEAPCGTYGSIVWEGFAQYYSDYEIPYQRGLEENIWIIEPTSHHPWGSLPGVYSHVYFTNLLPDAIGLHRLLRISWNCCGQERDTKYSYLSISSTRQTGER